MLINLSFPRLSRSFFDFQRMIRTHLSAFRSFSHSRTLQSAGLSSFCMSA